VATRAIVASGAYGPRLEPGVRYRRVRRKQRQRSRARGAPADRGGRDLISSMPTTGGDRRRQPPDLSENNCAPPPKPHDAGRSVAFTPSRPRACVGRLRRVDTIRARHGGTPEIFREMQNAQSCSARRSRRAMQSPAQGMGRQGSQPHRSSSSDVPSTRRAPRK